MNATRVGHPALGGLLYRGLFGRGGRFVGGMTVRWFGLPDGRHAAPPGIEGDPIAVGVLVATGSGLAHFDVVNGMDLPHRGAHWIALGTAWAGGVGGIEEKLPGDPVRDRK